MNRILLLFALLLSITFSAFSQGFEIKLTIKGLKDTTCQLAYYYGDKQYIKDSARVDQTGRVIFKGAEDLPAGVYLTVVPGKNILK